MISGYFLFVLLLNLTFYNSKNNSVTSVNYHSSRKMHFSEFFRNKYLTKLISNCSSKISFSLKTFQCETRCFFQIIVDKKTRCVFAMFTFILG